MLSFSDALILSFNKKGMLLVIKYFTAYHGQFVVVSLILNASGMNPIRNCYDESAAGAGRQS
jgi:hypothetical protein